MAQSGDSWLSRLMGSSLEEYKYKHFRDFPLRYFFIGVILKYQRWVHATFSSNMYTTGGLSTRATESPPQAQQGFADPTASESDSLPHSSRTQ